MSEVKFKLYDADAVLVEFALDVPDSVSPAEYLRQQKQLLVADGFSIALPDKQARQERTDQAVGYIWGQYNDSRSNQIGSCLHIYNQRGKFKQYTVYPERFDLLPGDVLATKPADPEHGVTVPPETEAARRLRAFKPWNVVINIKPRLDRDGNVVKKDDRWIVYEFAGVAGTSAGSVTPANSAHDAKADAEDVDYYAADKQPAEPATKETRTGVMHALGMAYYGSDEGQWKEARAKRVTAYGKQRKPPVRLLSSTELTPGEVENFIAALEESVRGVILSEAENKGWSAQELAVKCREHTRGAISEVSQVSGVALARILKDIDATVSEIPA